MATIKLSQVEKRFGDFQAVKPMDLTINNGEFVVLLGPSGCGKTTTLRMISGLETATGGQISIDGRNVTWMHPSDRDIAFVFQLYALYPHMTVQRNITFPLEAKGESAETIARRLGEVTELLRIKPLLNKRPGSLSGGDRQRVALARALVRRPAAFLMDEPLGALDADFRETMRAEIKRLHIAQSATTVYVTHDQIEAMAMGDRIVVMSNAEIQQIGTPVEVYHDPANLFVAGFIGSPGMNLVSGAYRDGAVHIAGGNCLPVPTHWQNTLNKQLSSEDVILGFRPEAALVADEAPLSTEVYADDLHGPFTMLHLSLDGTPDTIVNGRVGRNMHYPIGSTVRFDVDPQMLRFFDATTEQALTLET
jgi:multiple sugar transport system ATP-binding protein